jgi:acetyl-CoA synthetase
MSNLLTSFISKTDFESYKDFRKSFTIHVPTDFNFAYDVVDRYARECPDKEALVWCDDAEEKIFSFRDLSIASQKTANYLVSKGIHKGDPVMLILRRRYEFWFFLLALHRIGAIAVPATNMLTSKDIEYRTNAADIKMIVTLDEPELQEQVEGALSSSPTVQNLVTVSDKRRTGWLNFYDEYSGSIPLFTRPVGEDGTHNDDVMLIYFTSGTSGYPKMVQHTFTYPLGHIVTAKYWQNVVEDGRHLTIAETGWAKAMWGKIYGQWIAGCAVFCYDILTFVPGKMLEKMAQYKITTFCAPPTAYRYLIQHDFSKYDLSHLKYCTTAGEAMNVEVYNKFLAKTGLKIHEGYGQTELTLTVGTFPWIEPRPGSMGKPAPGYDLDVVHPDGSSCTADEIGEIIIRVDKGHPFGMFAGYFHNTALTDKVFAGEIYHTGDTAWRDKDGYIWFVGRTDDLIKSAGYRISPFEVENTLQQHPAVLECAVTGVKDSARSQAVKATIVLTNGYEPSTELAHDIQKFARHTAASYKCPRIIEFVKEIPKTISGKIRHNAIREQDAKKAEEANQYSANKKPNE